MKGTGERAFILNAIIEKIMNKQNWKFSNILHMNYFSKFALTCIGVS